MFRVTRVAKLVNKWKALGETLSFIWSTFGDIINFLVLLALFVLMYAVIGMELYAGKAKFNEDDLLDLEHGTSPRYNFDNLRDALLASYTLVIGENWASFLYVYCRVNYTIGIIYFYSAVFIMNVFLVNVFTALILQNFFADEQKKLVEEEERRNHEFDEFRRQERLNPPKEKYRHRERTLLTALKIFRTVIGLNKMCKEKKKKPQHMLFGTSLYVFSEENPLRLWIHWIVRSDALNFLTCILMIANSVLVTFETKLYDPNGPIVQKAKIVDICLAVYFIMEILAKIFVYGLIANGEESYFRNPWNILDTVSTLALVLQLCISDGYMVVGEIIMLLRALRVSRLVTVREGFQLSIQAIGKALPSFVQTLGIAGLFFFVFSVFGIHYYKGMMYYCSKTNITGEPKIVTIYDCMDYGGEWRNTDISFDNMLMAFMTLFELLTAKFWWTLVLGLADNYGVDKEPVEFSNTSTIYFVVLCTIVGFLFVRAIITGLINFAFTKQKEVIQGVNDLDSAQRKWVNFSKIIFKATPIKEVRPMS